MHKRVEQILREFASQSLDIEGAILVSSQGQPITVAVGIEPNSALILAGLMLRLAARVDEEFTWKEIEQVSIRAHEGYVTLIRCHQDAFLLVKTTKVPWGLLDRGIHRTIKILRTELQLSEVTSLKTEESPQVRLPLKNSQISERVYQHTAYEQEEVSVSMTPSVFAPPGTKNSLDRDFIKRCQQELAQYIGPIASVICKRTLSQNPHLKKHEFIQALTQYIPQPQQASEFQRQLLL